MALGPLAVPQQPLLLEAVAVLPVRDLAQSLEFYGALGFAVDSQYDDYAIVFAGDCWLHLRAAAAELNSAPDDMNPAGAYLFVASAAAVFDLCAAGGIRTINEPEPKPWNVIEFAVSDPSGNLLRFGERMTTPS